MGRVRRQQRAHKQGALAQQVTASVNSVSLTTACKPLQAVLAVLLQQQLPRQQPNRCQAAKAPPTQSGSQAASTHLIIVSRTDSAISSPSMRRVWSKVAASSGGTATSCGAGRAATAAAARALGGSGGAARGGGAAVVGAAAAPPEDGTAWSVVVAVAEGAGSGSEGTVAQAVPVTAPTVLLGEARVVEVARGSRREGEGASGVAEPGAGADGGTDRLTGPGARKRGASTACAACACTACCCSAGGGAPCGTWAAGGAGGTPAGGAPLNSSRIRYSSRSSVAASEDSSLECWAVSASRWLLVARLPESGAHFGGGGRITPAPASRAGAGHPGAAGAGPASAMGCSGEDGGQQGVPAPGPAGRAPGEAARAATPPCGTAMCRTPVTGVMSGQSESAAGLEAPRPARTCCSGPSRGGAPRCMLPGGSGA